MASSPARRGLRSEPSTWALVALGYALACALVLALGFDHVSDDDYARVTIAQAFAHRPQLDPSGTSWLPFQFWALGSLLTVVGRSLAAARGASIALASLAAILPYAALRGAGAERPRAIAVTAFALLSPWSVWLGAATVPESFTASAIAGAAIGLASESTSRRARVGFAVALLAACLSRYEAWPVAAVLAVAAAFRARRERSAPQLAIAAILALGPLAWMAWNLHAHGDPLHFFVRVSRFKRALGEGATDPVAALLLYPRLLVTTRPDAVLAGVLAATRLDRATWVRWRLPLACAVAQLGFLVYGNLQDGAPAHHAERALLGIMFVLAAFAADVLIAAPRRTRWMGAVLVAAWLATTVHAFADVPGRGPSEDRTAQIARGKALRAEGGGGLAVTPCAYEHFALIAAYGAPEDVTVEPSRNVAVEPTCPAVVRR